MTTFYFSAATVDNRVEEGSIAAINAEQAARELIGRGLYPIEVRAGGRSLRSLLSEDIRPAGLSRAGLAQLLADLGHLVSAGIEVATSLELMQSTASERRRREIAQRLLEKVRTGRLLSEALREMANSVPPHIVAIVRAGEVSNMLGSMLVACGESERKMRAMRSEVVTALIYPVCITLAMVAAIAVLVTVVVPTLEGLFVDQVQRLPWQTQFLVAVSRWSRQNLHLIMISAVVVATMAIIVWRAPKFRAAIERSLLVAPALGELIRAAETAQIAEILAASVRAKIPLVDAVQLAHQSARLSISKRDLDGSVERLRQGGSLQLALSDVSTLSQRMTALVHIGEQTGRLDSLLIEAARDAERILSSSVNRMMALLTPALTMLFGLVAGFVLYSIMTAILSVNDMATGVHQ